MSGLPVLVGACADLPPGHATTVPLANNAHGQPQSAIVVRDRMGEIRAYLNQCRHLPIPLDAGGGHFLSADRRHLVCATHGAAYRLYDGVCERGPCHGAALIALEVVVHDGRCFVFSPP